MPKYTTLNLYQILSVFLADLLYYSLLNYVPRVSAFCAFVRFYKVCQTYMSMGNLQAYMYIAHHVIFHLWCVVQCIAICHYGLVCRTSAHNIYTLLKHCLCLRNYGENSYSRHHITIAERCWSCRPNLWYRKKLSPYFMHIKISSSLHQTHI